MIRRRKITYLLIAQCVLVTIFVCIKLQYVDLFMGLHMDHSESGGLSLESEYITFEHIADSNFYLYNSSKGAVFSADLENREGVLLFGFVDTTKGSTPQLLCHIVLKSGEVYKSPAEIEYVADDHLLNKFELVPAYCWCYYDLENKPFKISISVNKKIKYNKAAPGETSKVEIQKNSKLLNIYIPKLLNKKWIGLCMQHVYNYSSVRSFVEYMEFYKLLGVEKFILYGSTNASKSVESAIKYYQKSGILKFHPWSIGNWVSGNYDAVPSNRLYHFGSHLLRSVCLQQYRGSLDYAIFLDLDEILIPTYAKNATLKGLFQLFEGKNGTKGLCWLGFPWIHMNVHDDYISNRNNRDLFTRTYNKRCANKAVNHQLKPVVHVDNAYMMLTHWPGCLTGGHLSVHDQNIAKLLHYRHFNHNTLNKKTTSDLETCNIPDNTVLPYLRSLESQTRDILNKIKLL